MSRRIELDAPQLGEREKQWLGRAIDEGYVSTWGPLVGRFETRIKEFLSAPYAVAIQSGTAALHMILYALGIGKGDEVLVPSLTFVASANPVCYVGAKPVFVDVDAQSWTLSPAAVRAAITDKTRAIIAVHLYGNPCAMKELQEIARERGLYLIEDATESLGARYDGHHTGTIGHVGYFSFNGNKAITTGGGGIIVSPDEALVERVRFLVNQARHPEKGFEHTEIGFNYRMTNLEAALGLAQIEQLDDFMRVKEALAQLYREVLPSKNYIFQESPEGSQHSHWMNVVACASPSQRDSLAVRLKEKNFPTRPVFKPLHQFAFFKAEGAFPVSEDLFARGLCLPSSTLNEDLLTEIRTICEEVF